MLARASFRVASRAGAGLRPAITAAPFRTFKTSPIRKDDASNEDHIPVVHYEKGQRVTEDIHVPDNGPVVPAQGDIETKAVPLKKAVYDQLTPTLSKFCLPGKVAIVTG